MPARRDPHKPFRASQVTVGLPASEACIEDILQCQSLAEFKRVMEAVAERPDVASCAAVQQAAHEAELCLAG